MKSRFHCVNCLPLKRGHCRSALKSFSHRSTISTSPPGFTGVAQMEYQSYSVSVATQRAQPDGIVPALTPSFYHMVTSNSPPSSVPVFDSFGSSADFERDFIPSLPPPVPMTEPTFLWGAMDGASFSAVISKAYCEVVHWRKQFFPVPQGHAGKAFVAELARLLQSYADSLL